MKNTEKIGLLQWFADQKLGKKILYAFVLCAILPIAKPGVVVTAVFSLVYTIMLASFI